MPTGEMKFGIKGVAADGDAEPSAACGGCSEAEEDEKPGSQGESVGLRLAEALGE